MKLIDYIRGKRRGSGAHRTELEAMRDPLLGEALDGYDTVPGDHTPTLQRLEARIAERARSTMKEGAAQVADRKHGRMRRWQIAAAAAVIVCVAGGTLLLLLQRQPLSGGGEPVVAQDIVEPAGEPSVPVITPADTAGKRESAAKGAVKSKVPEMAEQIAVSSLSADSDAKEYAVQLEESGIDNAPGKTEAIVPEDIHEPAAETSGEPAAEAVSPAIASALQGWVAGIASGEAKKVPARREISGRVIDAETGEPLVAAIVRSEDGADAVVTAPDGSFTLPQTDKARISAQLIGYEIETVAADTSDQMLIAMKPSRDDLSEVVVVAYGTQKKSNVTGAVSRVGGMPADTATTAGFRRYIAAETAITGLTGSATLEFEVNSLGRPYRIKTVESTSKEAEREASRLLCAGPDWEPAERRRRITITFGRPPE